MSVSRKPECNSVLAEAREGFQQALVQWFRAEAVSYPWRETSDPYEILVSEVMLQQTTIQAVIENKRFERFLQSFPNIEALAAASEEEILRAWEGLGYYNRVRNLQRTARAVLADHAGTFPESLQGLQALPGVGPYTSAAVASFAYDLSAPLVDANVSRVFSRLYDDSTPINSPVGQRAAWARAEDLVPAENARLYNAALMELGQKICKNKEVLCELCPVAPFCVTRTPLELPVKTPKPQAQEVTEYALWSQQPNGDLLMEQGTESRRRGMWRLPLISQEQAGGLTQISVSKYAITKYKVTLKVYASLDCHPTGEWIPVGRLVDLPMPSPIRKVVEKLSHLNIH